MASTFHKDFHHPYEPYDIQQELMDAVYTCMKDGHVGIFESPTGTGKSLSLICSSLTWLREAQEAALSGIEDAEDDQNEPSWIAEQSREKVRRERTTMKANFEEQLRKVREKERTRSQQHQGSEHAAKRRRLNAESHVPETRVESEFELAEYDSDEGAGCSSTYSANAGQGSSLASLDIMENLGIVFKDTTDEDSVASEEIKIFFCSRTHSQLTQFVHEVRKVSLPAAPWLEGTEAINEPTGQVLVKHLPLGSRKNLCINKKVAKSGNVAAINERCLELQRSETPKEQKCEFFPSKEDEILIYGFRDLGLAKVRDIEDLGNIGRRMSICPYYASRAMVDPSEIITLPYQLLLQRTAREALGISLKGHIVIVDEAHNLMDTINNLHSVSINLGQLKDCRAALGTYVQKFRSRLKGKNRVYLAQLVRLLDSMTRCLETRIAADLSEEGLVAVADLLGGKGVDQINLHKLMVYLQRSKLAYKVQGFTLHEASSKAKTGTTDQALQMHERTTSTPILMQVQSFIEVLCNPSPEGRYFYEKIQPGDVVLKYMLLDPTYHFKDIVDEARAVILAGGTMAPMDDYHTNLFSYVPRERLKTWSCGHIIPKENLSAMTVGSSLNGTSFEFTFDKRNSLELVTALGEVLIALANTIPDGMVVFFPSYAYLNKLVDMWKTKKDPTSSSRNIWEDLQKTKPVFQETKSVAVEELLASYSDAVDTQHGGLLLAVVGGRLSEGINFSDQHGRGVIVVGLPFPNMYSAQWKARLEYIASSVEKRTGSKQEGKTASMEFYENACMRAVNQSIGRAIRHKGDYAGIVLLDKRYQSQKIRAKLPAWIRQGFIGDEDTTASKAVKRLAGFFENKT